MKRLWNALIITAAIILFPVSCSFFGAVGTLVYSELDARDMAKGEEPHTSLFFVATKATVGGEEYYDFHSLNRMQSFISSYRMYAFSYAFNEYRSDDSDPSNCGKTFEASVSGNANFQAIDNADSQPHVEYTFLLPDQKGEFARGWTRYRYKAENISEEQQLIEVKFSDDDYQSTSRYLAEAHSVTPVYSKILDPGYMFISFPVAIALSTLLMFVIRHFRRKWFPKTD